MSNVRNKPRPIQKEQESPEYWYPKYQEWMTLNEYYYRKEIERNNKERLEAENVKSNAVGGAS